MPVVLNGTVFRFVAEGVQDAQQVIFTQDWGSWATDINDPTENVENSTVLSQIVGQYVASLLTLQLPEFTLTRGRLTAIISTVGDSALGDGNLVIGADNQTFLASPGTRVVSSDPMPTFNAAPWKKQVPKPGRNYRGSNRLCCLSEEDVTANEMNAVFRGTLATKIGTWLAPIVVTTDLGTRNLDPVVWSKTLAIATDQVTFDPLHDFGSSPIVYAVPTQVTSQVSRKKSGVGA